MSEIIHFKPHHSGPVMRTKSPEEALEYALQKVRSTAPTDGTLIIAWQRPGIEEDHSEYRYVIGGNSDLSASIGLLEITKATLLEG
jgi:hypothetical protein